MERNIIKQGAGGFTIYLPKKWADKKGLKDTDKVDITEMDGKLIVSAEKKEKKSIILQHIEETEHQRYITLTHLYRKGFEKITITHITPHIAKNIKKLTNDYLLGFEVVEQERESITLENISEPTNEKYDVILRRIFLIIKETIVQCIDDFGKGTYASSQIIEFRKQQDKYVYFCRRLLYKEVQTKDTVFSWELLTFLMHIEHTLYYLYLHAEQTKAKEKALASLFEDLLDYYGILYDMYFGKKKDNAYLLNKKAQTYQYGTCLQHMKGKHAPLYSYMREAFRLTQLAGSPVLAMLLE